jgi:hypothetical protein
MRKLLLLLSFFPSILFAQDEPGQSTITPQAYGTCTVVNGTIASATSSGYAACAGLANDDVFYGFVPTVAGMKVTGSTAAFNMVLSIVDASFNSVGCVNTNAGNGGEILWVSNLVPGQQYYVRIHSFDGVPGLGTFTVCAERLPATDLNPSWVGFGPSGDGYKKPDQIKRNFFANPVVQATRWKLQNTTTLEECTFTVNNGATTTILNNFPCVCFGYTYNVWCEVRVDNQWCGYGPVQQIIMEPEPTTDMLPAYENVTYDIYQDALGAVFVDNTQLFEWEFTTDNGSTQFVVQGAVGSSIVEIDVIPQMRYNKIYQVRIRARLCGVWGPWSNVNIIFIGPLPYTKLQSQYCNTTIFLGQTLIADFVENATNYIWQFAPITCNDPLMMPIGPAIVFNDNNSVINLQDVDLAPSTCYRVAVKPFVGEQQGDYGTFCQVTTAANIFGGNPQNFHNAPTRQVVSFIPEGITIFPNPAEQTGFDVMYRADDSSLRIDFRLMTTTGQLIQAFSEPNTGNFVYRVEPENLAPGMYLLQVSDGVSTSTERFMVK